MIKLLIEKDKSSTGEQIKNHLEAGLGQSIVQKHEDDRYVLLMVGARTRTKRQARRRLTALVKRTVDIVVRFILTDMTKEYIGITVAEQENAQSALLCDLIYDEVKQRQKKTDWYTALSVRALENMLESGIFAVNSFIRFRIEDYKGFIRECGVRVTGRLDTERRYMELISAMQSFVEERSPKLIEVRLTADERGYTLTDEKGDPLEPSLYRQAKDEGIDKEDLLMGILLAAAPKRIVVSGDAGFYDSEFFSAISNIFGGRLTVADTESF
ncbi:MAG: hypothetical protein J6L92_09605 [Clostridia bacterium]|nr:hypothetical protein [Clostridia bacterium]